MQINDIEEYFNKYGRKAFFRYKMPMQSYIYQCMMYKDEDGRIWGYDKIAGVHIPVSSTTIDRILMLDHYNHEVI